MERMEGAISMTGRSGCIFRLFLAFAIILASVGVAFCQVERATITGVVTDTANAKH